jgi:hypothetical protein
MELIHHHHRRCLLPLPKRGGRERASSSRDFVCSWWAFAGMAKCSRVG